jgi:DNA-binding MurR/RpiR family transcriptional regulator
LIEGARLSPAQRRIGRWLLEHPEEAVFVSSGDIAAHVGVSQPSVTRFTFALGLNGFSELRGLLREGVREQQAENGTAANEVQALVDTEIRDLHALRDSLADTTALREAAERLVASRPLPVLGLRVSHPLAALFGYFMAKVHPDVRVIHPGGSVMEDELSRAAEAGASCLLAYGLPRYPRELRDGLSCARDHGLYIVLITDRRASVLTEHADLLLPAPVSSALTFDSQAAPTVLTTVLLHTMLDFIPAEAQRSLEAFETSAQERRIFLPS